MKAFFGTFTNKIDSKGRVSVPASFRGVIAGRGLTSVALHPALFESCLEGAGFDRFENLLSGFTDSFVHPVRDEAAELIMEELRELPLDGDGRIVLPDEFIAKARLKNQATFVGRGWKFQLWEPSSLAVVKQAKIRRIAASLESKESDKP
ncbi:MAG TPA: division/cell wall cluster transcriptional repressor MraZ [Rhodospirillaceae bacterium]|nr:division/cell wall cluster transcriptional repressor MraZ [Candidatus Neomarinimicrobiota bacterium]HCX14161.1 division/cell wall cluster transcriptional repressor MraZ [Rhodospirillaceae bacterium]|tara:strand:- start:1421 stop:1870 length:450 start_codon:yes stop_codon:yes gene_type:complete